MTTEQKSLNRQRFVYFSMWMLATIIALGFVLALLEKPVAEFGVIAGTVSVPLVGGLIANFATKPS